MIQSSYSYKIRPIMSRNPQTNSTLENVHQIVDNVMHIIKVQDMVLDD